MSGEIDLKKLCQAIADCASRSVEGMPYDVPLSKADQVSRFLMDGGQYICHEVDGVVTGYVLFHQVHEDTFRVESIAVDQECQKRGVGHNLLRAIENEYPGCMCVVRWKQWRKLEGFFRSSGFSKPRKIASKTMMQYRRFKEFVVA